MKRLARVAVTAFLLVWSLAPVAWQALTAVKPDDQITRIPTVYVPDPPTASHFTALWQRKPVAAYLVNSFKIAAGATLVVLVVGSLAAAVLARAEGKLRSRVLAGLLVLALFPPILLLFPLYEGVRAVGWLNHPLGLILPYAALSLPLGVWILESGFRQIPRALDEAAILDGLGPLARVAKIQAPLAAPSVVAAAILVFIYCWNEFMLALTFMTRDDGKTITAGIASIGGSSIYEIPWGQLSAATVVATAPLVVLVLLFERHITSGLTRGAVKG